MYLNENKMSDLQENFHSFILKLDIPGLIPRSNSNTSLYVSAYLLAG